MSEQLIQYFIQFSYFAAAILFVLSLKWLSAPTTARRGVKAGEIGMLLAIVAALLHHEIVSYQWILVALVLGSLIGVPMAVFMPMTAVPQRTALSHAFGAIAAALVGTAEYYLKTPHLDTFTMVALILEMLLGFLTFTGSLMAFGKLQDLLPTRPLTYRGQNFVNLTLLAVAVLIGVYLIANPGATHLFPVFAGLCLLFGVLLILPIGGADMPTVIALLNSYAGLASAAMGFVLDNKLLIIAGALDGTSGFFLSIIMCKAMNRSFTNVLFGAFGQVQVSSTAVVEERPVKSAPPSEAATILEAASSVIIIMRRRCDCRYSTAGTSRDVGRAMRVPAILPARTSSSKYTADSTPSALTFDWAVGIVMGVNCFTPSERKVSRTASAFALTSAFVISSNDSLM